MAHFEFGPSDRHEAQPSGEQIPEKFQALVVLGKNWREYPPKETPEGWQPKLSMESKMSALAAGEMYRSGVIGKIIFSTGKTAGSGWPSEAQAMADYMREKYPDIPPEAVMLEEESIDTAENAERMQAILDEHHLSKVALMTVGFHLKRSRQLFEEYGMETTGFPSEEQLKKRSPHYAKFVDAFLGSGRVRTERVKETILRALLMVDRKGKAVREVTKRIRG